MACCPAVEIFSADTRSKVLISGRRNFDRLARHVLVLAEGEGEKLYRLCQMTFEIIPRSNHFLFQGGSVSGAAIDVCTRVADKLGGSKTTIPDLILGEGESTSDPCRRVV